MKSEIDQNIIDRIANIPFFQNCGVKHNTSEFHHGIVCIDSWSEAEQYFTHSDWEEITLEFRNQLTEHIQRSDSNIYKLWNQYAKSARKYIGDFIEPHLVKFQYLKGIDSTFIDCVKWDILNSMLYLQYAEHLSDLPGFYKVVLTVYEAGHFPCGWKGEFSNGRLIII